MIRRHFLMAFTILLAVDQFQAIAQVPKEPVNIARGVPQFFVDDWLVDNRYAVKYKHNAVVHSVHPPQKHAENPVYRGDCGYVNVARHPESGKFQLGVTRLPPASAVVFLQVLVIGLA